MYVNSEITDSQSTPATCQQQCEYAVANEPLIKQVGVKVGLSSQLTLCFSWSQVYKAATFLPCQEKAMI